MAELPKRRVADPEGPTLELLRTLSASLLRVGKRQACCGCEGG